MRTSRLSLPEIIMIEPDVHEDQRGSFSESWNRVKFAADVGEDVEFVQDNQSRSAKGVLRGLHYQVPPAPQGKLVRVVAGSIWDVAVDIGVRRSPSEGGPVRN
jgi:dTDP-4-dehydrorhamnose 3,5-epimerase